MKTKFYFVLMLGFLFSGELEDFTEMTYEHNTDGIEKQEVIHIKATPTSEWQNESRNTFSYKTVSDKKVQDTTYYGIIYIQGWKVLSACHPELGFRESRLGE